ncbi:MAG: phosphoribosyltransferase family protein [Pseudomonadales bacterium]
MKHHAQIVVVGLLFCALGVVLSNYVTFAITIVISIIGILFVVFIAQLFNQSYQNLEGRLDKIERHISKLQEDVGSDNSTRLSWSSFWIKVQNLYDLIRRDGYEPDIIISIGRSGAVVGGMLATQLKVKHVDLDRAIKERDEPDQVITDVVIEDSLSISIEKLQNEEILCVMSECETGDTLLAMYNNVKDISGLKFRTAVIFEKKGVTLSHFIPSRLLIHGQDFLFGQKNGHHQLSMKKHNVLNWW